MKKVIWILPCLVLMGGFLPLESQEKQADPLKRLMLVKLKSSQLLLEGLAIADFAKISNSAEELIRISKQEEWHVLRTPKFQLFTNEFQRAAGDVAQKARDKNIDGVTLSFFELTMSCVRCHKYVREVRDARLDLRTPPVVVRTERRG
jgi:hypothetical protein